MSAPTVVKFDPPVSVERRFEEALEHAYWEFDAKKAKGNYSERDCFKQAVRGMLNRLRNDQ